MSSLVISNFNTGYETDREPFLINNDAFPVLNNAYIFRGRINKIRGTIKLCRLERTLTSQSLGNTNGAGLFTGNIRTILSLETNSSIDPSSISFNANAGAQTFSDQLTADGNILQLTGAGYITAITNITLGASTIIDFGVPHNFTNGETVFFNAITGTTQLNSQYGFITSSTANTITVNINSTTYSPYAGGGNAYRVSGSINYSTTAFTLQTTPALAAVPITATFGYFPSIPVMGLEDQVQDKIDDPELILFDQKYSYEFDQTNNITFDTTFYKSSGASFTWNGGDYQQFWTENANGAMWTTNGLPGFHFIKLNAAGANLTPGNPTVITYLNHGLTNNDFVFINEVQGTSGTPLNGFSGQVTRIDANNFSVAVNTAALAYTAGTGIVQYLTRSVFPDQDGIRWYDGSDPTNTIPRPRGWVNFAPPLTNVGFGSAPTQPDYLVGAKLIKAFKDRIIFFGVWKQKSTSAAQFFPNQIVWCQNGTPFYSLPVPTPYGSDNTQSSDMNAWIQNVVGRGGRLNGPASQEIITVESNEDVLLCGFETYPTKLIYTNDDTLPFLFQSINSELGSSSTFSGVSLDIGAISIGTYGISLTTQTSATRIDLKLPDAVFDISRADQGDERVTAGRDFRNEFIYFTFPIDNSQWKFPTKTLLYNYRENNWATLDENYTTYGYFRRKTGWTWATLPFRTWSEWTVPWNFGQINQKYPFVIGGNQQGYVMIKDIRPFNDPSGYIKNITGGNPVSINSPDHCLQEGDYILLTDILGTIGTSLNGIVFQVLITNDKNNFTIDSNATGTYLGGGQFTRIQIPDIRSKQFPVFWDQNHKSRISTQMYLLDSTDNGQITANIYVNESDLDSNNSLTSSYLPFTNVVLTSPEPDSPQQAYQNQIWHRSSNSFIGDTVQIGITLSDPQIRDLSISQEDIVLHAIVLKLKKGPILT